ncbi:MAG TPA: ABC transporter [Actinobacteria bacterium]|jgi:ABC transporter DrrB family efflux protein|nr:ABC transporter [Actinomycetota bacterium]
MSATSATVEPLSTGKPIPRSRPLLGWHLHDGIVVGKRNLIQTIRVPELLFFSLVQPVIFVLMFAYVFGGAIPVPGASGEAGAEAYRAYLIPGIFAQTVAFAAASSTVGIAEDMHKGLIDRFRSLPMKASAVLFGRTFADAARMILVLTVLTITGLVVGWRINDGFINAVFAYALLLLFAYVVAWIGSWIGLYMPNPETANTAGLIWLFPLTFVSNAFVPLAGMPAGLQAVAAWNPLSALTLSCRELFGNPTGLATGERTYWSLQNPELYTLLSCALLLAIFVPLAVRKYRRTTAR